MKTRILLLLLLLVAATSSQAVVVYSGVQNIPIPQTLDGVYLRISDGAVSGSFPADWNSEPWLNPFFGGVYIGSSDLFRPIVTGADQILNITPGTLIDSMGNFAAGESGSSTHVGAAANQFQIGMPGLIGLAFQTTVGGPEYYGWLRMTIDNTGNGSIVDWAYDSTAGTAIQAGATTATVPETAEGCWAILLALPACVWLRRRFAVQVRNG
jgi:hypothetical protein